MKAVELFAGAGGLAVGLARAGFDTVFANDVDLNMCASFEKNHPGAVVDSGSVVDISADTIYEAAGLKPGDIDLVAGGPPCQGFSTVGKKDESDPRNMLPVHYLRLVEELQPPVALFENVAGFKRLYKGRVFDFVLSEFERMGYEPRYKLLNAVDFGVPQQRIRTIILATRPGHRIEHPEPTHGPGEGLLANLTPPHLTLEDALSDLPVVASGERADRYETPPQNAYQDGRRARSQRPLYQEGPRHGDRLLQVMSHVPAGGAIADVPKAIRPTSGFGNTYARLWWDQPSTTITRNLGTPSSSRCIHPLVDRGLTTTEGARLQSFDDDYVFLGPRTSKNLQIGNAVPPVLAEAIGSKIYAALR